MQFINRISLSHPLTLSTLLVVLGILMSQVGAILLGSVFSSIPAKEFAIYTRYGCAALMVLLVWKLGGLKASGISNPTGQWHQYWWLATLPMLVVVGLNLSRVQWHEVSIEIAQVPNWLFSHLATGLFEEVMMRAMVFYILMRAWSDKRNGLIKAAIAQAAIFGGLHLLNLLNGFSVEVIIQVVYATLLGISFAGIVAFSRTIWPAVICHALINAAGSINRSFVPGYVEEPTQVGLYMAFTLVIFVSTTVPALYMLKRIKNHNSIASAAKGEHVASLS